MNSLLNKICTPFVKYNLAKNNEQIDSQKISEEIENYKVTLVHGIRDTVFIVIGIVSAGFGLKGFLLPNSFIIMNSVKDTKSGMIKKRPLEN